MTRDSKRPCWKWTSFKNYKTPPFSDIFTWKLHGSFFNKYYKQSNKKTLISLFDQSEKIIEFPSFLLSFRWICTLKDGWARTFPTICKSLIRSESKYTSLYNKNVKNKKNSTMLRKSRFILHNNDSEKLFTNWQKSCIINNLVTHSFCVSNEFVDFLDFYKFFKFLKNN